MTIAISNTEATPVGKGAASPGQDPNQKLVCRIGEVPVYLVGPVRDRFAVDTEADSIRITPREVLGCRHTIRPVALFHNARGYPDLNSIMGRVVFPNHSPTAQTFRPFTLDPRRELKALFLPIETMPDDEWNISVARWQNCRTLGRHLLDACAVPAHDISDEHIGVLVKFVEWADPHEGCLLYALTQWTHGKGCCVIEVGSFRGRSASTLSLALEGIGSNAPLISVDPHVDQPFNRQHMQVAARQIGQEDRLIQILRPSDDAAGLLRPEAASFIFIDGDHSYEQVVSDFQHYRDLLAVGGCMAFHDYGHGEHHGREDHCPGVRRAVDEYVLTDRAFRPLLLADTLFAFVKLAR